MSEIRIKRDNSDWDNRPAHQFTNGEWIDIPTHHFINGRWQGELTSQSPLKFRADGEMLDWRVDGKTSENLFDVKHFVDTAYCHNVVLTQLDNGIRIQATSSNDPYVNYVNGVIGQTLPVNMRNAVIPCKSNIDYTLCCAQSSRIGKYISYFDKNYKVVGNYTPFSGTSLSFKTPETCVYILLRIGDSSTLSEGTIIELTNIQLLEGTYTTSTIPPYEPYGGVGDWDETTQRYKIPVRAEGENLYTIELGDDRWGTLGNSRIVSRTDGVLQIEMTSETNSGVYALSTSAIKQLSDIRDTTVSYSFDIRADTDISVLVGYEVQGARATLQVSDEWVTVKFENILFTQSYSFTIANRSSGGTVYVRNFMFNEGSTAFPYEGVTTNLYTDHQLMDGDSIDYATDQTAIPIATGNNILTVDTAVQPSKVFVKFEG